MNETSKEVRERKSFFFNYDANKLKTNTRIFDFHAPGNPDKHPSVMLEHEHVHP